MMKYTSALIGALVDALLEYVVVPALVARLGSSLPPHVVTRAKNTLVDRLTGVRSWADMKAVALEVADMVIREHERTAGEAGP